MQTSITFTKKSMNTNIIKLKNIVKLDVIVIGGVIEVS